MRSLASSRSKSRHAEIGRLGVLLLMVLAGLAACSDEGLPAPAAQGVDREAAAVTRGIEWLLEREPSMTSEWAIATFELLARIVENEEVAESMRGIVAARSMEALSPLPENLRDPAILNVKRLRPILLELDRRRRVGIAYEEAALEIQEAVTAHEPYFWESIHPTQQIMLLHRFAELGIETRRSSKGIVQGLERAWRRPEDQSKLLLDLQFMFGVTHLPYLATGYYQRPASAEGHVFEKQVLDLATRRYVGGPVPPNPHFVDLQGEVLIARKLLGMPENSSSRVLRGRLLSLQNEDGSWGDPSSQQSIHATTIMVEVFTVLPEPLRP